MPAFTTLHGKKSMRSMKSVSSFDAPHDRRSSLERPSSVHGSSGWKHTVQEECETCERKRPKAPVMFKCHVLQAHGLPSRMRHSVRHATYLAEISIDGVKKATTDAVKSGDPIWDQTIFDAFPVYFEEVSITVRIICVRHTHGNELVAYAKFNIDLLDQVPPGEKKRFVWPLTRLHISDEANLSDPTVEVILAHDATGGSYIHERTVRTSVIVTESEFGSLIVDHTREWVALLQIAEKVMHAVDGLAELHPYASIAWKVLSSIPRIAIEKIQRDEQMRELCELVRSSFSFVKSSEPLKHWHQDPCGPQLQTLAKIVRQAADCCRFMRTYADESCRWRGSFKHIFMASDVDAHIKSYTTVLLRLQADFHSQAALDTQLVVYRLLRREHGPNLYRASTSEISLQRSDSARLIGGATCTHGARGDVVDYITRWIESPSHLDDTRALFLTGNAESETALSAVACEVAAQYSNMARLASSFTFGGTRSRSSRLFITTLAQDLADFDERFAAALRESVAQEPGVATSADCTLLFSRLVRQPAEHLSVAGPVVVVVDALHVAGTRVLPSVLCAQLRKLPANFRFVFTAAADPDLERILSPAVHRIFLSPDL